MARTSCSPPPAVVDRVYHGAFTADVLLRQELAEQRFDQIRALTNRVAAVDADTLARDPARLIAQQERDHGRNVIGLAEP